MPATRMPRTMLEEHIRALPMTLEEFAQHAETYAREHRLDGTLSLRHLQRLVTGERRGVRPATARLLEALLGEPIGLMLSRPATHDGPDERLDSVLAAGYAVDEGVISALRCQLTALRELDRRLGALSVVEDVRLSIQRVDDLAHAVALPVRRRNLLAVLTELRTMAGWLALDQLDLAAAWRHHNRAVDAAREAESPAHHAHAQAQQAVVMSEAGRLEDALALAESARDSGRETVSSLMFAWLEATAGELHARAGRTDEASRAFDRARQRVTTPDSDEPYLGLDASHLDRWRVSSLADSPEVKTTAADIRRVLDGHDRSFRRAETSLRIDLALTLNRSDRDCARRELATAQAVAELLSSPRLRARLAVAEAVVGGPG